MNPFLWLLWGAGAALLLAVGSAVVAGILRALRKPQACPWCGFDMHLEPPPGTRGLPRTDDRADPGR